MKMEREMGLYVICEARRRVGRISGSLLVSRRRGVNRR